MFDLKDIKAQVQRNCEISDARYAGNYSVCGLFLQLRDLYKWEKGLDPWIETESRKLLDWIDEKEQQWDRLSKKNLAKICISDIAYDPFDVSAINRVFMPQGFFYGGGYARGLKPTFFIGKLKEKKEISGCTVCVIDHEFARDLFTSPSLVQDDCIIFRHEVAMSSFWDKIFYVNKSSRSALDFGLKHYGLSLKNPKQIQLNLAKIVAEESKRYIFHELGEIQDMVFNRDLWREIISCYPHSPVELLARSVKDLLADTSENGPLRYFVKKNKNASLGFFVAFLDNFIKVLFPEIFSAFNTFIKTDEWGFIEEALEKGHQKAMYYAETMSEIHRQGKQQRNTVWAREEIQKQLLSPLGL